MSLAVKIPVGSSPDWETKGIDEDDREYTLSLLRSPADSLAIHHSLRQSRNTWLTGVFPKFSTKGKTKSQSQSHSDGSQPPPHVLKFVGKCDFEIGPHVFPDTAFHEAQYLPEQQQQQAWPVEARAEPFQFSTFHAGHGHPKDLLSGKTPYATGQYPSASSASAMASLMPPAPAPLLSSLETSIDVTPGLITQVNAAASSNPTLQNLLAIAASGKASIDQLKTLGVLIQTMAGQGTQPSGPPASALSALAQQLAPTKRTDLVLEFRENNTERLLFPREIVTCERQLTHTSSGRSAITLCTFVPFECARSSTPNARPSPAVFRLVNASSALWDSVSRWVNEDAKAPGARDVFRQKVSEAPARVYLQHRLADEALLEQLQAAATNYTMKPLKPSSGPEPSSKPKRAPRPRKPSLKVPTAAADIASEFGPPKRKRAPSAPGAKEKTVGFAIACTVCGQTDVPLLQGGQYCRSCSDAQQQALAPDAGAGAGYMMAKMDLPIFVHSGPGPFSTAPPGS